MNESIRHLTPPEQRVLGSLLEKEMATPEYYPLTLNALANACNQKTNREPVVSYDGETVQTAIDRLKNRGMVRQSNLGRTAKFEQIFTESRKLTPREKAVLAILLLRGPQTIGEIRGRTERLYSFADLDEVRETVENLDDMNLVARLALQPGRKEARYHHLLGGETATDMEVEEYTAPSPLSPPVPDRLDVLETEVARLKEEMAEIRREFAAFRSQFE